MMGMNNLWQEDLGTGTSTENVLVWILYIT